VFEEEWTVPANADLARAAQVIAEACAAEGLRLTLDGTLAKYPGCRHWHYKRDRQRGTLEITLWPARRRLWVTVHAGRQGDWIAGCLPRLGRAVEAALGAPS
jgi:hypothetical protein